MRGLATLLEGAGFVFKYLKIYKRFLIFYGDKTAVKLDYESKNGYIYVTDKSQTGVRLR